jgi:competence protein ComEC
MSWSRKVGLAVLSLVLIAGTAHGQTCGGKPLTVHFYDVAQALSALVDLPDGRHILVDTADYATRAGCGAPCQTAAKHLKAKLKADLGDDPIAMVWITHQHSDHIGGLPALGLPIEVYVDNGRDGNKTQIKNARAAAKKSGAAIKIVDPDHTDVPIASAEEVKLTALVPAAWPDDCAGDPNDCSIVLRIDYCDSSIMFTGDAEEGEESVFSPGAVTLLQVGHHGSDTSTSAPFLSKLKPKYAVISSGKKNEGMNRTYCHPRATTVEALTTAMGGAGSQTITAFDAVVSCRKQTAKHWKKVPATDTLWCTARDGDVVLTTPGDGTFIRQE